MTKGKQYTIESFMMANGRPGTHFYSDKSDRHLTAIASHHKRTIKTERLICVTANSNTPTAFKITKITILN